ncbi:MAG: FAD-dependent oxidoreductase [Kiritimatiellales bacterium]|nr:FAD-dependent oxidoreductase [Kiritimatiellales bacterium]
MSVNEGKAWRCTVCGYIHYGDEPPDECPVCNAPASEFEPVEAEAKVEAQRSDVGKIVIAGAGIAGLSAAGAAREAAPDAEIVLISTDTEFPYYRLNLTRYLAGEISDNELPIHPPEWYADNRIELLTGNSLHKINAADKTVLLQDGTTVGFDRLVVTTGAYPFIPPIGGTELTGVFSLRTADNARAILDAVQPDKQVVVIGGGILGLETAGALALRGAKVTVLEAYDHLMPRQLNAKGGAVLLAHLGTLGIDVIKNARAKQIEGEGIVSGVRLKDDTLVPAEMAVITVGVRSNAWMLQEAGLIVNRGVLVDNFMRTSNPDILAAGDVCEHDGVCYGSWAAAQYQGKIAGMNAAGIPTEFGGIPRSHMLKILGKDMVSIGLIKPEDGSCCVIEDEPDGGYRMFMFRDDLLVGTLLIGDIAVNMPARSAIESRTSFVELLTGSPSAQDVAAAL